MLKDLGVTAGQLGLSFTCLGIGFATVGVAYGAIVQRETPSDLMGRVAATTEMLTTIVPLVAPFAISLLAAWLGVGGAFAIADGGLMVVGAVVVLGRGVPVGIAEVTSDE